MMIQTQEKPQPYCGRNTYGCDDEPLRPAKLPHLHRLVLPCAARPHHIAYYARWNEEKKVEVDFSEKSVAVGQNRVGETVVETNQVPLAPTNRDQADAQNAGKGDCRVENARCKICAQGTSSDHKKYQPRAVELTGS